MIALLLPDIPAFYVIMYYEHISTVFISINITLALASLNQTSTSVYLKQAITTDLKYIRTKTLCNGNKPRT